MTMKLHHTLPLIIIGLLLFATAALAAGPQNLQEKINSSSTISRNN